MSVRLNLIHSHLGMSHGLISDTRDRMIKKVCSSNFQGLGPGPGTRKSTCHYTASAPVVTARQSYSMLKILLESWTDGLLGSLNLLVPRVLAGYRYDDMIYSMIYCIRTYVKNVPYLYTLAT